MDQGKLKRKTRIDEVDENAAALTPDQAHARLGGESVISRASFYNAINRGEVPHIRMGRRIIIPRQSFTNWLSAPLKTDTPNR